MSKLSRTYSSPSLRANIFRRAQSPRFDTVGNQQGLESQWKNRVSHLYNDHYERDEEEFYVIGDRVLVDGHKSASVAYFGEVEFASGDWVGVVMDNPLGNHNGKVHGREYFQCAPFHGLFVRPHRVTRMPDSAIGSGRSSRTSTPLPTLHQRPYCSSADSRRTYGSSSPAPSSVTTDSYFYDDDYRQSRLPTIASLGQRIDEIEANPASRPPSRFSQATPVGILKKTSSSYQNSSRPRSRSETRQNRGEADHTSYDPSVPVFNFRPRRVQLDQLQHDLTRAEESTSILSDASNRANAVVVDSSSLNVGDRVYVRSDRGEMSGTLRFMGETNFATGEWAGIELDQADGKNDGSVLGYRYFYCPQKYGLFVPATRVRKQQDSIGYKAVRSTIKSPPPLKTTISNYASISNNDSSNGSSRSMTPSSYYSDKTTPSPVNGYPSQRYSSSSSDINSLREDISDGLMDTFKQFFSDDNKMESPKFDDDDIDYLLKRSLLRKGKEPQGGISSLNEVKLRPKCVKYTFSSSKYDGNPIARRTVEYD